MYSSITSGGQVVRADGPALAGGALGPAGDVGGGAVAAHLQVERWSVVTLYLLSYRPAPPCRRAGVPSPACPPAVPWAARCRQRRRGWSRQRSTASVLGDNVMLISWSHDVVLRPLSLTTALPSAHTGLVPSSHRGPPRGGPGVW